MNLDRYNLIEEDICWLINNGRIKTKTNIKRVGKLLELLKWLEAKYLSERDCKK